MCDLVPCCPAQGSPYDLSSSQVAAEATVRGLVALPDREALQRTVAPVSGPVRMSMSQATAEAVSGLRARLAASTDAEEFTRAFVAAGQARVREALAVYSAGGRLDDRQAALLGLDLAVIRVRDEAWMLIDDESQQTHLMLWKDLTRRLEPRFVPPAAALLGMASWRSGDCALASIALERALEVDPGYSMANLLMHALHHLLSPRLLRDRMPTAADLDNVMGVPRATWLLPLLQVLDEKRMTIK